MEGHLKAILEAEPPTTRKTLQSLIGTLNWLNEYVPNFAEIISPMTDLLSPRKPYKWNLEAQKALDNIKIAFSQPRPLSRPDSTLPFILQTDASAKGMGGVLMQQTPDGERKIISYASAKFSETESRYHCNEQECLAIIWAIKHYRPYLEDRRFTLRTDSKTLTWLKNNKDTRAKLTRWHLLLSEFSFDIEHCPGKHNELPDALSRFPNPDVPSPGEPDLDRMVLPTYPHADEDSTDITPVVHIVNTLSLFEEVSTSQQDDEEINRDTAHWLELREQPHLTAEEEKFLRDHNVDLDGFWKRSTDGVGWLFRVPTALQQKVISEYHDKPLAGHPGTDETIRSIKEHFFWPGMNRQIRRYIAGCHLCICCKPVRGKQPENLRPRPTNKAWDTIAVDLMGPYPLTSKGNRFILVVTDMFSRWVEAFPLRNATATRITQILENEVFSRWGYPRRILSDNGSQFTGHTWTEASQKWDSELWTTPTYHPRANPTERRNQEIKKGLRLRLHEGNQRTWDKYLPELLFGLRRRRNAAIGTTPSNLLLGRNITLPGEWRLPTPEPQQEMADGRIARQQREMAARRNQQRYQERYATNVDTQPRYATGERVYARNRRLSNKATGYNAGLGPSWTGPHVILENISGEVYWILKNNEQCKVHGKDLRPSPPEEDIITGVSEKLRPSLSNGRTASQAPPTDVGEKLRPSFSRKSRVPHTPPTDVSEKLRPSSSNERTASQAPPTDVSEKLHPSLSNKNTVLHTPPIDVGGQSRPSSFRADSDNDDRARYMLRKRKGVTYRDARPYVAKEK